MVEGQTETQTVFTYDEVTLLLSKYILARKDNLFDPRNIKLALVKSDPLGTAFNVAAFHRSQVNTLLKSQLLPVNPEPRPQETHDQKPMETSGSLVSDRPSAFPALSKAASAPSGNQGLDQLRKRIHSGEKEVSEAKLSRSGEVKEVVRRRQMESDTETIYSEQDYDTVKEGGYDGSSTEVETEIENGEGGFEVEYEIDSGEEEERPPQAGGVGAEFSSSDDTDTADEKRVLGPSYNVNAQESNESVYWGDSEEEKEADGVLVVTRKGSIDACVSCKTTEKPKKLRFCGSCWDLRKSWAPERPKRKNKAKKSSEEGKKITPIVVVVGSQADGSGTDEMDGSSLVVRERSDTMDSGVGSQEFSSMELEEKNSESSITNQFSSSVSLSPAYTSFSSSASSSSGVSSMAMDVADLKSLNPFSFKASSELCGFCESKPKNAIFIHGNLGHQVCCYSCAKKAWKQDPHCPVCKRKVEKIIKNISV